MLDLFRPVADDIFFISGNGTVVRTKERLLHSWHLEQDIILPIIESIRGIEGASFVMETPGTCYTDAGDDSQLFLLMRDNYHYDIENVDDVTKLPFDKVTKFAIYHPTSIETSTEQIRKDPRFAHLSMTISGAWWLDITPREAGKGEAYALLQEYLGIKKEETVYFGDNLNDLSAFKETGIAATVANARQELKEAADLVERSYAKNGVVLQACCTTLFRLIGLSDRSAFVCLYFPAAIGADCRHSDGNHQHRAAGRARSSDRRMDLLRIDIRIKKILLIRKPDI